MAWAGAALVHGGLWCQLWWAVFSCCLPLADSQRVRAASVAVQRAVESAERDAQREEPEGLEKKISLIIFVVFRTLNVPQ